MRRILSAAHRDSLRQHNPELRAPLPNVGGGEHDRAAIAAYEIGRDNEAETRPAGAAGTEWSKELRTRAGRNAGSRIADFNMGFSVVQPAVDPYPGPCPSTLAPSTASTPLRMRFHEDTKHLLPVGDIKSSGTALTNSISPAASNPTISMTSATRARIGKRAGLGGSSTARP